MGHAAAQHGESDPESATDDFRGAGPVSAASGKLNSTT